MKRDAVVLDELARRTRPASLLCINLQNFKAYNDAVGHAQGDLVLAALQRDLEAVGWTQRTSGDEFVCIVEGDAGVLAREVAWRNHIVLRCTWIWTLTLSDGRTREIPRRTADVVCTPRIAHVEVEAPAATLTRARERCTAMCTEAAEPGFPPRVRKHYTNVTEHATPTCPVCEAPAPIVLQSDLDWARERCAACSSEWEREDKLTHHAVLDGPRDAAARVR